MLATLLVMPGDTEELALTLNGKKRKITRQDFVVAFTASGLNAKIIDNLFAKFRKMLPQWLEFIDISFLPLELKERYKTLLTERLNVLQKSGGE